MLETPAASLAYDERGVGEPVVFLHSGLADRRMWEHELEAVGSRHRAIRYDLQGFGDSRPTGPGTHRGDCVALLDGLGIGRCHLVGSSFGGAVALEVALEHPERVRSLTLIGPVLGGHDYDPDTPEWAEVVADFEESFEAFEAGDLERAADLEVDLWVVGRGRSADAVDPAVLDRVRELNLGALRLEAEGERRPDATELTPPAAERLGSLAVPLLFVAGEHDLPHVHDARRRLEEAVPDARSVVVDDTAHLPSLERPEHVTDLVLDFLDAAPEPEGTP